MENLPPIHEKPSRPLLSFPKAIVDAYLELLNRARAVPLQLSAGRVVLKTAERQTLLQVLEKHGGSRKKTAAELGISPVTLWRKLKTPGL